MGRPAPWIRAPKIYLYVLGQVLRHLEDMRRSNANVSAGKTFQGWAPRRKSLQNLPQNVQFARRHGGAPPGKPADRLREALVDEPGNRGGIVSRLDCGAEALVGQSRSHLGKDLQVRSAGLGLGNEQGDGGYGARQPGARVGFSPVRAPTRSDMHRRGAYAFRLSTSSSHNAALASLGMRQSPRGLTLTDPTLGPSGRQLRLNCWAKKRR